jgi:hypothetical protein
MKAKQEGPADMFKAKAPDTTTLRLQKKLQKHEDEADINSVPILANAGYSYGGSVELLDRVGRAAFSASPTHSGIAQRIRMIEQKAQTLGLQAAPVKPFPPEVKAAVESYFNGPDGEGRTTLLPLGGGRKPVGD